MRYVFASLISFCLANADQVLIDVDFNSLPPYWTLTGPVEWTFGGCANIQVPQSIPDYWGMMNSYMVPIPYGTDSLVIETSVTIFAYIDWGSGDARFRYISQGVWHDLWVRHFGNADTTWSETIHASIPFTCGQPVSLYFDTMAGYGPGGTAFLSWTVFPLTMTAYGEVGLESDTWAQVKAVFDVPRYRSTPGCCDNLIRTGGW
ncbi:MAG: hypothetical protein QUS11_07155 [Candidatus Fermentibacter sp.]|nr:hypothetical protein [Candidatus Fermentibacter sp.]